jgi:hypothetical protein
MGAIFRPWFKKTLCLSHAKAPVPVVVVSHMGYGATVYGVEQRFGSFLNLGENVFFLI